ncbi:hypothetical protein QTP88_016144 [Uroleucon formosanum]
MSTTEVTYAIVNVISASSTLTRELASEDPDSYCNFFRINEDMFNILLKKVENKIMKCDTIMRNALSPELKLEITMRYLATGDSYKSLQYLYRVLASSICSFLPAVFDAIYEGLIEYIQVPKNENEWKKIINGFNSLWNFPNCFGAIDGKHIMIQCPPNTGSNYYNYKGSFSIVLLALVDHNYNFECIDIGNYGSNADAGIFEKSNLKKALEENVLKLPDGAVIKPISLAPETVVTLVKAACSLHNWIRKTGLSQHSISVDIEDLELGRLIPGSWRNEEGSSRFRGLGPPTQRNPLTEARKKRDSFAEYFVGEGEVSWQNQMIE